MFGKLTIASSAALLALSTAAFAQTPGPAGATTSGNRDRCDLMSREEMQLCLRTQPGDASGARSSLCDQIARSEIESCLQQGSPGGNAVGSSGDLWSSAAPRPGESPGARSAAAGSSAAR
jgi:hypothetical protein